MNLDLLVCALVLLFAVLGLFAGALMQLSHWAGLLVAGALVRPLGVRVGPMAAQRFAVPEIVGVLGVTVVAFFALYAAVQILARAALARVARNRELGRVDRVLGLLLGGAKAAFVLYVLLSALIFFEKPFAAVTRLHFDTRGSRVAALVRAHDLFSTFAFPGTRGLLALARAARDPSQLAHDPELLALARDPRVSGVLRDAELQRALQSGDALGLLRSDRVLSLLADGRVQAQLVEAGERLDASSAPKVR